MKLTAFIAVLIGVSILPLKSEAVATQYLKTGYCELTGSVTTPQPNCGGVIVRFSGPSTLGFGVDTGAYMPVFLGTKAGQNPEATRTIYTFTKLTKLFPNSTRQSMFAAGSCTVITDSSPASAVTCQAFADQWQVRLQAEVPN